MQKKHPGMRSGIIIFIFLFIFSSGIPGNTQEKPYQLLGYAVVPDIKKTLDTIEKIAIEVDPVHNIPNMLKMQAGMFIGDPALQNIDPARPVLVMLFYRPGIDLNMKKESPRMAMIIPVKDKDFAENMIQRIKAPSEQVGNVIIISENQQLIPYTKKEMPLYLEQAGINLKCDARFMMKIESITEVFSNEMDNLLKEIQANMNKINPVHSKENEANNAAIDLGKIFIYGIFDIIKQSKDYLLDISLNESAITIESEHTALPGTALSSFFKATAPDKNKCLSLLPDKGLVVYAGYFDVNRTKAFIDSIVTGSVKREPRLQKSLEQGLINVYLKGLDFYLGEIALRYGFAGDGKIQGYFAASTDKSDKDFIELQKDIIKIFAAPDNKSVAGFQEYEVQENVRSYKGVSIHRYIMKISALETPEIGEMSLMRKIIGEDLVIEFAVSGGFIAGSTSGKALDEIIDNINSGGIDITLDAVKFFGPGMDSYMDLKIIDIIEQILKTAKSGSNNANTDDNADSILKTFAGLNPEDRLILASGDYNNGVSCSKYKVSTRMITELLKFINQSKSSTRIKRPQVSR